MRRAAILLPLATLAGCGSSPRGADATSPGARLEAAAIGAGLVRDPARLDPVGSWARDGDRLCLLPGDGAATMRIGALVDYGEGQGCAASGSARRRGGGTLAVTFGGCRFDATIDGDRLSFPAELPDACESLCTGRATLAALSVDHLSTSTAEADTLRSPQGKPLCGSR